jgi:pSer/pThr/pTyr-binding forkhead associated (FHA) protein/V8-like Glu-specific endopeptidase
VTIELRVLSGARAGTRESFDKPPVTIGRHAASDFRFDPEIELDVSTKHAELHDNGGVWTIHDQNSTNGTYVNGERIAGERRLNDGDVVSFGAHGPRVEMCGIRRAGNTPASPRTSVQEAPKGRVDTSVRVAIAVEEQTRTMRRSFMVAGGALIVVGALAFIVWQRQAAARENELIALFAHSESTLAALQQTIVSNRPGDSTYTAALKQELDARKRDLAQARQQIAAGTATTGSVSELSKKMDRTALMQQSLAQIDVAKVHDLNDPAVAMLASDFDGKFLAGTAFGITPAGLLITNRHVVRTEAGVAAQRLMVIYANTNKWLRARVVRVSDTEDLALIQVEDAGKYPVVAGVSRGGALARVGAPVASIGYPGATDTPMEGTGMNITARTTSTRGSVSKRLDDVLQIDSYAGHGSSGSPVFDTAGHVVGVIWGGDKESNGRIVYAVPAQKIAAFIGGDGAGVLR